VEVVELPWRTYPRGLLDNALPDFGDRLRVDVDVMLQDELAPLTASRQPRPAVPDREYRPPPAREREPRRLSPLYRAVERRYLATVDGVVCNSAATATRSQPSASPATRDSTVVAPPAGDRFDPAIDDAEIASRARNRPLGAIFRRKHRAAKGARHARRGGGSGGRRHRAHRRGPGRRRGTRRRGPAAGPRARARRARAFYRPTVGRRAGRGPP